MSNEMVAGLLIALFVGLMGWGIWTRVRARPRDREALRRLCDRLGGTLELKRGDRPDAVATLQFGGHTFTAYTAYIGGGRVDVSSSRVMCELAPGILPVFSVYASGDVGDFGKLDKRPPFKYLRLETESREVRDQVRALWPESAKEKMRCLVNPRALREGWIPALDGAVSCDGQKLRFGRTVAFRRVESYLLAIEMLSELIVAGQAASNRGDAAAHDG